MTMLLYHINFSLDAYYLAAGVDGGADGLFNQPSNTNL
jgi:hypothetical protein